MNRTMIEWVKNPDGSQGYTWNPITGCENHINGLCKGGRFPCYAYRLATGRLKARYLQNLEIALPCEEPKAAFNDPFYPRFWPERLAEVEALGRATANSSSGIRRGPRRGIFLCDMGELFGSWLPKEWTESVLEAIENDPEDRFYLLTKQPQELIKWSPFPSNTYIGISVTNQAQYDNALKYLAMIEAPIKFLSFEPLLERINPDL